MQISSISPSLSSRRLSSATTRGFTLVELVIVIAITALISTVVVIRFYTFDSTILLKSLAYEIAVSIREAQVFSLSVLGASGDFDKPYGISFVPGKEYILFQFNGSPSDRPSRSGGSSDISTFRIGRSLEIMDVCVEPDTECVSTGDFDSVDISFRRPEFDSIFFVEKPAPAYNHGNVTSATIEVGSTSSSERWLIEVSLLGQITVTRKP